MRLYHTSDLHDRRGIAPRLRACAKNGPDCFSIAAMPCAAAKRATVAWNRSSRRWTRPDTMLKASAIVSSIISLVCCGRAHGACAIRWYARTCAIRRIGHCRLRPSLRLQTAGGITAHVLGLLIMQYPVGSAWERVFGWRFLLPWDAIAPYAAQMPDGDALIVLSHLGLALDRELAARVPTHRHRAWRTQSRYALRNRSMPEAYRSCMPDPTASSSRAPRWNTTQPRAALSSRASASCRCWAHRDTRPFRLERSRRSGDRRTHRAGSSCGLCRSCRSIICHSSAIAVRRTCMKSARAARCRAADSSLWATWAIWCGICVRDCLH